MEKHFYRIRLKNNKTIQEWFTTDRARIAACEKKLKEYKDSWVEVRLGVDYGNGETYIRQPEHGEIAYP